MDERNIMIIDGQVVLAPADISACKEKKLADVVVEKVAEKEEDFAPRYVEEMGN